MTNNLQAHDPVTGYRFRRRDFLARAGGGIGLAALASLEPKQQTAHAANRFGKVQRTLPIRARRVIWLFMHGGPSHVDLFDPKPMLTRFAGKKVPQDFGEFMTRRNVSQNPLLPEVKPYANCGDSGLPISTMLPHTSKHADDLLVIRSLHGDSVNHPQSVYQMNTGSILMGHPSFGSWLAYGLGSENEDMPAFVVLPDPGGGLKGGPPAWGNGYLPASYQGVTMRPGDSPILNLRSADAEIDVDRQASRLKMIQSLNARHRETRDEDDRLDARIDAYEMAFRMQAAAPEIVDLSRESRETHSLYGINDRNTADFGRRCLLARRMIERGVRFVQVYSGDTNGWDAHKGVLDNHTRYCQRTDLPIAGLLTDLKQRGLLEDTLVIWGGEFGRMPMSEQGTGRDHNPWGYCAWLAGAGLNGGRAYGATDEIGLRAAEDKVHVNEFHATLLHLLGIDHEVLTYQHNGLDKRLTGPDEVYPVKGILHET